MTTSLRVARFIILKLVEIVGVIFLGLFSYKVGLYVEKVWALGIPQPIGFVDKISLTILGILIIMTVSILVGFILILVGFILFLLWELIKKNWEWAG